MANLSVMDAPRVRLIGPNGPDVVNSRPYGSVVILDQLFTRAELRMGVGDTAETVTITRQSPRTIDCPGHSECPPWPTAGR